MKKQRRSEEKKTTDKEVLCIAKAEFEIQWGCKSPTKQFSRRYKLIAWLPILLSFLSFYIYAWTPNSD
jgi:hypothetical protein